MHVFANPQIVIAAEIDLRGRGASYRERDAVVGLIRAARQHIYLNVPFVIACEAAPGVSASTIARDLAESGEPNLEFMAERGPQYVEGVVKDMRVTHEYWVELKRVMETGSLYYWQDMITYVPPEKRPEVRQSLETMIGNLGMHEVQKPKYGESRYKLTAKVDGCPDDMLIALMMSLYWRGRFWRDTSGKYRQRQQQIRALSQFHFLL